MTHPVQWWPDDESNNEGTHLDILFYELGLTQLIPEPTHFWEHCHPSCIDLIICDHQPNPVIDSGFSPRWTTLVNIKLLFENTQYTSN